MYENNVIEMILSNLIQKEGQILHHRSKQFSEFEQSRILFPKFNTFIWIQTYSSLPDKQKCFTFIQR